MAAKILKYAAPSAAVVVGVGSFRIYSVGEKRSDELISPKELSIYSSDRHAVQYVDEKPGLVQTGLGALRAGLQPYVRAVQNGFTSVKAGIMSAYQAGEDTYYFLRDPPPGFLPRVGFITVSGLGGLILARKGSHLKKTVFPLGLAALGTAVCYPIQTVGVLKITGKKLYNVSSSVAAMIQSKPKAEVIKPAGSIESTVRNPDPVIPTPESEQAPVVSFEDMTSLPEVIPAGKFGSEVAASPETTPEPLEKSLEMLPLVEPISETPNDFLVNTAPESADELIETVPEAEVTSVDVSEATPAGPNEATPTVSSIEEAPPTALEDTPPSLAAEASSSPEPLVEQVNIEPAAVKSRFVPDPTLLDHGQASPEDADMYSTRS